MIKEVTATGKDIVEAKENARIALGADPLADVNYEIVDAGSKGIFGIIGTRPAKVRAYIEIADKQERPARNEQRNRPNREQRNDRPRKNDRKNDAPKAEKNDAPKAPKTQKSEAPRAAVIPETELKFEKMDVKDGEDMSFEFVKAVLRDIGLDAEAEILACEDGSRRINISGADASALIGHHGDTLDALQYLTNLASAQKNVNGERNKSRVTIDIEGYRAKREETLRALARRMAAKALRNKRSVMLEPMSAYERRIIHSEVQNIEGVSTNSIGSDNNRKIVIYLTDKKPQGLFEKDGNNDASISLKEEFSTVEGGTDLNGISVSADDEGDSGIAVTGVMEATDDNENE